MINWCFTGIIKAEAKRNSRLRNTEQEKSDERNHQRRRRLVRTGSFIGIVLCLLVGRLHIGPFATVLHQPVKLNMSRVLLVFLLLCSSLNEKEVRLGSAATSKSHFVACIRNWAGHGRTEQTMEMFSEVGNHLPSPLPFLSLIVVHPIAPQNKVSFHGGEKFII